MAAEPFWLQIVMGITLSCLSLMILLFIAVIVNDLRKGR